MNAAQDFITAKVIQARRQAYSWAAWRLFKLVRDYRDTAGDPQVVLAAVTNVLGELDDLQEDGTHAWVTQANGYEDVCQYCSIRRRTVRRYDPSTASEVVTYVYRAQDAVEWGPEPSCHVVAHDPGTTSDGTEIGEAAIAILVALAYQPGIVLSDEDREVLRRYLAQPNTERGGDAP